MGLQNCLLGKERSLSFTGKRSGVTPRCWVQMRQGQKTRSVDLLLLMSCCVFISFSMPCFILFSALFLFPLVFWIALFLFWASFSRFYLNSRLMNSFPMTNDLGQYDGFKSSRWRSSSSARWALEGHLSTSSRREVGSEPVAEARVEKQDCGQQRKRVDGAVWGGLERNREGHCYARPSLS